MFSNKVALVTGASRGIGAAIADHLGLKEASVIGTATTEEGAEAISRRFSSMQIKGCGMLLNVTDQDSIDGLIQRVAADYGAVSILVNNAGITRDNLLMRMKEDEWNTILDTNLSSIFRLSRACLRAMIKARTGRIINIASVVGSTGNPGQTNYAAAKAGMIGFTKSLAREVGSRGITVNAVAPGFIETDMTGKLADEQRKSLLNGIPLGHLGDPIDIANAVVFLASEHAGYITGETLHVNGGMFMG